MTKGTRACILVAFYRFCEKIVLFTRCVNVNRKKRQHRSSRCLGTADPHPDLLGLSVVYENKQCWGTGLNKHCFVFFVHICRNLYTQICILDITITLEGIAVYFCGTR